MESISEMVAAARRGDRSAFAGLVKATQSMALAVAADVLREPAAAEDAVQQAYLRAFRRLDDLVLAWGVFNDRIVRHLGADPGRYTAIGVGCGLERLAMLRYGIDDIRKVDEARVA